MSSDYEQFIQSFYHLSGIDLSQYKEAQMKRRLTSFYERKGFDSFLGLYEEVKKDPILLEELLDKMTINVSEFYRNGARWDILKQRILPDLLQANHSLKVWSAACSTGEEPYTLAMILREFLPLLQFRILATDIDENAIFKAKAGKYHERSIQELPVAYKDKWLIQHDQWYEVRDELKKRIEYKKHNLLNDPFPQELDLIVCRNVLIYFTEEAKYKLYKKFADSLKKGGILFVGSTEQIFRPDEFHLKVISPFFYQKL
ncbi:chemotaxis protein methyltransferase CheR [Bacillus oleivorans]|uniref:protein-glutamate O-methyltransferase n=1 Tax=Bacillus oleivorans TaxID=1448271 RepID=A0A285CKR7_9BACI|nr:protein-glutamate O-methyltransferase CheR [Bacillus oleivorans]SNX68144.1 chemotaxis protein methyltransferase CheR [Bacillus oleivorans]